jgi:3-phenylpropionate/trans-cinnamate dioxygenase ferredoxin component
MDSQTITRTFVQVAKVDELADGAMKEFKVGGREIFLARAGGRFFAADNICPHMGGKLGQGTLEGTVVTCPRHHSKFDLVDGRVIRWTDWTGLKLGFARLLGPPRPIVVHPVKIEGENVLVQI